MSFRAWLSVVTFLLIAVIIYFSRHELLHAWGLLAKVNIWILLLIIPAQIFMYYAGGEMIFSYLRAKKSIDKIPPLTLARMALEMNFVNHVLPSGGVSGISYMTWRLGKFGVTSGRATMAQAVRFAVGFAAFILLLVIAVFLVTIDGNINRWIILMSSTLVTLMVGTIIAGVYLMSSSKRMSTFAVWLTRTVNFVVRRATFRRKKHILSHDKVNMFFSDMHRDFVALRADKRILIKPFLWGLAFTLADISLFLITFWALGSPINPAPVLIAYGVATIAGFFVVTPGGAGAYEAIMVAFLAIAGVSGGTAIAGIVLTRVILLISTIALGYLFYQHAIIKYGKNAKPTV
ncbi:MAG TPA: lysylphosphatidylglycerol synthase transmembrane domain-containing protein [Candidatus Saccharimonadales bacterium]|nr:lysylphosphatidylglycerol synthase transmembrane domain-containing protein [Candidatus Saccharimonadales bacterium]